MKNHLLSTIYKKNRTTDEMREDSVKIRTELELVLKHVRGGEEKVNAANYLTKPPHL